MLKAICWDSKFSLTKQSEEICRYTLVGLCFLFPPPSLGFSVPATAFALTIKVTGYLIDQGVRSLSLRFEWVWISLGLTWLFPVKGNYKWNQTICDHQTTGCLGAHIVEEYLFLWFSVRQAALWTIASLPLDNIKLDQNFAIHRWLFITFCHRNAQGNLLRQ